MDQFFMSPDAPSCNSRKRNWRRRLAGVNGSSGFGLLGAPADAGGLVSRARAINRHELRGNEAGRAAPERYAHDAHDDHGRADATGSNLGNERRPDAPCFQRIIPLFPLCYLLLEKLSKSLIPLGDCPFMLNRLPVLLGKSPCFQAEAGFEG